MAVYFEERFSVILCTAIHYRFFLGGARGNMGMNGGGDGKWQHHNGILLFIFFLNPTRKYKKREERQKPEQNKNRERNL